MNTRNQANEHYKVIHKWMKGDEEAITFVMEVSRIVHVWDDLIDKDRELTPLDINEAFWSLFFTLPNNRFYMRHFNSLNPMLLVAEINWRTANSLEETGSNKDLEIAYIIRSSYVDVIIMSAMFSGGREWAYTVAPDIRRWVHSEGYEKYVVNFDMEGEK